MTDRRIWFFLGAAVVSLALTPPTPASFRWVPMVLCCAYLVLVVLVGLDTLSRRRQDRP